MGAADFETWAIGETANEAFSKAVEAASWEHGHGGYTGTIAEKGDFVMLEIPALPDGVTADQWIDAVMSSPWDDNDEWFLVRSQQVWNPETMRYEKVGEAVLMPDNLKPIAKRQAKAVEDKWGPAGCYDVTDTPIGQAHLEADLKQRQRTGVFETRGGKQVRVGSEPTNDGLRMFVFIGWASE